MAEILLGDCLEVLRTLPACSVDAVVTDPPYYRVKDEDWDRQWDNPSVFLSWLDQVAEQWQRVLKPNGSLYCFASPQMAARVEVLLGERFQVLNNIRWTKAQGWHEKAEKEALRSYLSPWEAVSISAASTRTSAVPSALPALIHSPMFGYLTRSSHGPASTHAKNRSRCCGTSSTAAPGLAMWCWIHLLAAVPPGRHALHLAGSSSGLNDAPTGTLSPVNPSGRSSLISSPCHPRNPSPEPPPAISPASWRA
jgi:hypothetical protein